MNLIRRGWRRFWNWTGFRGKTLWDLFTLIGSLGTFSALIVAVITLNSAREAADNQAVLARDVRALMHALANPAADRNERIAGDLAAMSAGLTPASREA